MISEPFVLSHNLAAADMNLNTDELRSLLTCLNDLTESKSSVRQRGMAQLWINADDLGASR
jgi:hypothetical protein